MLKTLSHKHDAEAKHNIFITCFHCIKHRLQARLVSHWNVKTVVQAVQSVCRFNAVLIWAESYAD